MTVKARTNWLDRAIGTLSPRTALRRAVARGALEAHRAAAYEGASTGRRTDGWRARESSADTDILSSLSRLRARVRDLERNNPHARKARSVWTNNLIAWGIEPRPATGSTQMNDHIKALWEEFADTCDFDGQLDFAGLQELMVGTMVSGGEALIRRHLGPVTGARIPLQLQVMEGDHLDLHKNGRLPNGHRTVQGVEFDGQGRRAGYWMFPDHPGDQGIAASSIYRSERVPAGEIAHLYRKERTQTRGVPWGASVVLDLRDLQDYNVAELVRKKTEACVVAIVMGAEEGEEGIAPSVTDASGKPVEQFEPGLIAYAHGGKEVRFNTPSSAGGYAEYRSASLHTVAAGYLVPYELLTGDLSEVNFASSRVGIIEYRRLVTSVQWVTIIPMALMPIWRWFCEACFLAGLIDQPEVPVEWDPPEFESINPIDDANANLIRMRSGEMTLFEVIGQRGLNPRKVLEEHREVARLMDEYGLVFDSDPRDRSQNHETADDDHQTDDTEARGRPALRTVRG